MVANPPQMPPQALALLGSTYYRCNGVWNFTRSDHPGMWKAQKLALAPRFGIAYCLNDKTALRLEYARYVQPLELDFTHAPPSGFEDINVLEPPSYGSISESVYIAAAERHSATNFGQFFFSQLESAYSYPRESAARRPVAAAPPACFGAIPIRGNLITTVLISPSGMSSPVGITASVTYFANFGVQQYSRELNAANPSIGATHGNTFLNRSVANPFYHYQNNPALLPGNLYNQPTVTLGQMPVPCPNTAHCLNWGTRRIGVLQFARTESSEEI